jgi:glutamine synthetase
MNDTEHVPAVEHYDRCPRWLLQSQCNLLKSEFNITILMGFEIEIVFMRPVFNEDKSDIVDFKPFQLLHSWTNMTYQQLDILPIIEEIVDSLADVDIHVPEFHSESAPGQWEFPLPAYEPVKAVDVLFKAKDVIRNIAKKHGLKATCYPRPYTNACGSACHAHFSLNGPANTLEKSEPAFLAGILDHLPAICAFTLPIEESYERIAPGIWSGGEYICWGTHNKEVPIRKCGPGHYELKPIDGIGNSYLGMAALLAAGLHGLRSDLKLEHKDCMGDPTAIGEEERLKLGIVAKLPDTLEKSLRALDRDKVLRRILGYAAVDDYLAVTEGLMHKLRALDEVKRRTWLMARY